MSSQIKRYSATDVPEARRPGLWVHAGDLNQALEQAANREAALQQRLLLMGQKVQQSDQMLNAFGVREAALQQRLTIADQRVDDLQADLAAARELLKHGSSPTPAHCESALDFLAGQSAPAPNEDDWHMNPCQQGHRDVGASGGTAYCYTCDETITAATTQEAFEQWNATHPATQQ